MIDLNEMAKQALETADKRMANGANIKTDTISMLKHCATEVVEATEAYAPYSMMVNLADTTKDGEDMFEGLEEPDSAYQSFCEDREHFASELADIICCALIIAGKEGIDIEKALLDCMERNRKRAEKHGDKL